MTPTDTTPAVPRVDTVAVVGLTGSFGGAVARELARRGQRVRALVRDAERARAACGGLPIEFVVGDAERAPDLEAFARGADVLVWGFNVPYPEWRARVPAASRGAFDVAARLGLTVLFPGNVYALGPGYERPLGEDAPQASPSRKGQLRRAVEASLEEATTRGARAIVLRAGDFIGERAPNAWFGVMVRRALAGGAIVSPSPAGVPHAWAYLPDLAHAAAELLARRGELAPFATFHFAGHVADEAAMVEAIRLGLGDPERRVRRLPWWLLAPLRPFVPMIRELFDVRYLWTEPVLLDDRRLRATLGPALRETPLREAVAATLAGMGAAPAPARPAAAAT